MRLAGPRRETGPVVADRRPPRADSHPGQGRFSLGAFVRDVRAHMTEREGQLRQALGLDDPTSDESVDPATARSLLDDLAGWRAR